MQFNTNMRKLLQDHGLRDVEQIAPYSSYPIWQKHDVIGRPYWGVSHFWGIDRTPVSGETDLSILEWDGNEVYLSAQSKEDIPKILTTAIGILKAWKTELELKYPNIPFYLFASYDNGDALILDEGEEPTQAVFLRFWAYRDINTVCDFSDFDTWNDPALVEQCNF